MPGYWWECEECLDRKEFPTVVKANSMAAFVWDRLMPAGWDQSLLVMPCGKCGAPSLRIAYEFPRADRLVLRVVHIVGVQHDDYVPMMWETYSTASPSERNIDFKYQVGRNPFGLNKAALLSRADLHELFARYREKTGITDFP